MGRNYEWATRKPGNGFCVEVGIGPEAVGMDHVRFPRSDATFEPTT
jgi:hypothetical protein